MCEMFVARATRSFALAELWTFAERLERYGIAGFGWGAAWQTSDGRLAAHVDPRAFRDDPTKERLAEIETGAALVHLRRPSRLSTLGPADTQPFLDRLGRFAYGHNGDFRHFRSWRSRYRAEGRIKGRADSEVGFRWLEDAWDDRDPRLVLSDLHGEFGGQANVMLLATDGRGYAYAGNRENPIFTFVLGDFRIMSTGIYSLDRSLFRYVAHGARDVRLLRHQAAEVVVPD